MFLSRLISVYRFDFTKHRVGKRGTLLEEVPANTSTPLALPETPTHHLLAACLTFFRYLLKDHLSRYIPWLFVLKQHICFYIHTSSPVILYSPYPLLVSQRLSQPGIYLFIIDLSPLKCKLHEQVLLLFNALSPVPNR